MLSFPRLGCRYARQIAQYQHTTVFQQPPPLIEGVIDPHDIGAALGPNRIEATIAKWQIRHASALGNHLAFNTGLNSPLLQPTEGIFMVVDGSDHRVGLICQHCVAMPCPQPISKMFSGFDGSIPKA